MRARRIALLLPLLLIPACHRGKRDGSDAGGAESYRREERHHERGNRRKSSGDGDHKGKGRDRRSPEKNGPEEQQGDGSRSAAAAEGHRWSIKTTLPIGSDPDRGKRVTPETLVSLPNLTGVTENDVRFEDRRIRPTSPRPGLRDGDVVTTTGWLQLVSASDDGDYHMQITPTPAFDQPAVVIEIPDPSLPSVASVPLAGRFRAERSYVRTQFLGGSKPGSKGTRLKQPQRVQVTGQLFYDDAHVGEPPRGRMGQLAGTLWEIHPVTWIRRIP